MTIRQRLSLWLSRLTIGSAPVTAVPVGRDADGLTLRPAGTTLDKPWSELYQEFTDARDAWHKNPLARRIIGLTTSYVVGNGISLSSQHKALNRFIADFWQHNQLDLRLDEWSDELARAGELFPVLFTNPLSGMSTVRTVPACLIQSVDYDPEDYEKELRYQETTPIGQPEKWWTGPAHDQAADPQQPLMLHYAVNRPVGSLRGESDLAPILPWLRRYSRWLEDRVRLHAAMRAFLWIVHAPARLRATLEERYRTPPEAGSVIIAEQGAEEWQAVTPNLHAADAEKDGRAIRWMIVAGGPGTALLDIGEGEDANLATGQAMAEQRRRFLRRRQAYLVYILTDLTFRAWQRHQLIRGRSTATATIADIIAATPDISPEDNTNLATAASHLTASLQTLAHLLGEGPAFRRLSLRLFTKFIGEALPDHEFETILEEGSRQSALGSRDQNQNGDDDDR